MSVITTTFTARTLGTSLLESRIYNFPSVNANSDSPELQLDIATVKGTLELFKVSCASNTYTVSIRDRAGVSAYSLYELVRRDSAAKGCGVAGLAIPFLNGDVPQKEALYMVISEAGGTATGSLAIELQTRGTV
jgi:hypothetical protein